MEREQIYQAVIESAGRYGSLSSQESHRFGSILANCKPEEVFWGLILVFQRSKSYNHQKFAGRLLDKMKPQYKFDLASTLRSVIDNWNVSVWQLPIQFARVYGKEALLTELSVMEMEVIPEGSYRREKIRTIRWWLTGSSAG